MCGQIGEYSSCAEFFDVTCSIIESETKAVHMPSSASSTALALNDTAQAGAARPPTASYADRLAHDVAALLIGPRRAKVSSIDDDGDGTMRAHILQSHSMYPSSFPYFLSGFVWIIAFIVDDC